MSLDHVESTLRALPLPRAPQALRGRVLGTAKEALEKGFQAPRPRIGALSVAGALVACAAVVCVVFLAPSAPPKPPETADELLARLRDPKAPGRARAIALLGELAGRKSLPLASSLLEDPDPTVRSAAARVLCLGGAFETAVPALLRDGRELGVLNFVRYPEAWRTLSARPAPTLTERSAPDRLRRLARAAGLVLTLPAPVTPEEHRWASTPLPAQEAGSILAAMEAASGPYGILLEPGTVRLLPRSEALRVWTEWWNSR
jgi:hypothetical protein